MSSYGDMIAACGLDCGACEGYLATIAGDAAALERARVHLAEIIHAPNLTLADVTCEGCQAPDGHRTPYCAVCDVRACALERGVATCAHCTEHGCATLEATLAYAPESRVTLERIRASLQGH